MPNVVRAPSQPVAHGNDPSQRTANVDLSAANWTASADSVQTDVLCPRSFVANFAGTLVFQAKDDTATRLLTVNAGQTYPISLYSITRASCSASLQVANALLVLY